ncbi:hypothetical protein YQ44_14305 [Janthinobacterium sp. 1_2014MBL_MicDiv]|nr:hypothetical protein YQ44_14305 [Janthinobacterium sp. 1_2014MBL_MicDiv]
MHDDMMNCRTVNAWLEMAQDDEVFIDADDINREAMENLWSFSPTAEETPEIHAADTGQEQTVSTLLQPHQICNDLNVRILTGFILATHSGTSRNYFDKTVCHALRRD